MDKLEAIKDLKEIQSVYRELYTSFDTEGAIAVHIEFDNAIDNIISFINEVIL